MDERRCGPHLARSLGRIKGGLQRLCTQGCTCCSFDCQLALLHKGKGKEQGRRSINGSDILSNAELPYSKSTPLQAVCSEQRIPLWPQAEPQLWGSPVSQHSRGQRQLQPHWLRREMPVVTCAEQPVKPEKKEFTWHMGGSKNMGSQEKRGNS